MPVYSQFQAGAGFVLPAAEERETSIMNYYHAKLNADAQRSALRRDAEQRRLASSAEVKRKSTLTIHIEINVGSLRHWGLKWNALREIRPVEDTFLRYDGNTIRARA